MVFILFYSSLRDDRGYWVCMSCFIVPPQCGGLPVGQVGRRETAAVASSTVRLGAQSQAGALVHSCGIYRHPGELMSNQPLSCREFLLLTIKTLYYYSAALMVIAAL